MSPDAPSNAPEQRHLRTRRRLLDAALQVFETNGYHATSVEEIVSAAGVARATFYLHFKNKLEVVHLLTDDIRPSVADLYAELDQSVVGGTGNIRPAVRQWLKKALNWYAQADHRIIAGIWQELSVGAHSQVAGGIAVDVHLPRYLGQWPADGRDAPRTTVILLSHLLSRAVLLSQRGVLPADRWVVIDSLADLWAAGLAGGRPDS